MNQARKRRASRGGDRYFLRRSLTGWQQKVDRTEFRSQQRREDGDGESQLREQMKQLMKQRNEALRNFRVTMDVCLCDEVCLFVLGGDIAGTLADVLPGDADDDCMRRRQHLR